MGWEDLTLDRRRHSQLYGTSGRTAAYRMKLRWKVLQLRNNQAFGRSCPMNSGCVVACQMLKNRLLASDESCRNQISRYSWIWRAKRAKAFTNFRSSRTRATSNARLSTELRFSKNNIKLCQQKELTSEGMKQRTLENTMSFRIQIV